MNATRPRRTALLALAALAAAGLTACSGTGSAGSVTVLGPWTGTEPGTEGHAFGRVLDAFAAKTGIRVTYQDTRALGQVLLSNVQGGTPPDVAILSSVGELARYARAGDILPLDDIVPPARQQAFPRSWLLPLQDGHIYTVPVKANLKSLIWFNQANRPDPIPQTWDQLMTYTRSKVAGGDTPWCMGMGDPPSSGWPGTDLIEDILLRQSGPEAFSQWGAGRRPWNRGAVAAAWNTWAKLVTGADQVRGGPRAAVLTNFQDAGQALFDQRQRRCFLDHQASFIMSFYQKYEPAVTPGDDFDFFMVPAFHGQDVPAQAVASADLAGMFRDSPQARQLMSFLAGDDVPRIWAEHITGAFSANKNAGVARHRDPVSKRIAIILANQQLCFDAADVMPAAMRTAFYRAVLEFLDGATPLPDLLNQLEEIRQDIDREDWIDLPCG